MSRHDPVPHDVGLAEMDERDALDLAEHRPRGRRSPERPPAMSIWVTSPVTTALVPKPIRVRNIFICSGVVFCASSRMTKLAVERAAAHERERRHLDRPALEEPLGPLGLEHVVEGVVERSQVGIDLGHEVPGQEAEPLAGLDRRPREDDAGHLFRLEGLHGERDREVGLAGPGGTDAEGDRVGGDRVDVALLAGGLGMHLAPARRPADLGGEHLGGSHVVLHHLDRASHVGRIEPVALFQQRDELLEQMPDALRLGALDGDLVATHVDVRAVERLLDDTEQLVALAEQAHHEVVPGDEDLDLGGRHVALRRRVPAGSLPAVRVSRSRLHPRTPGAQRTVTSRRLGPFSLAASRAGGHRGGGDADGGRCCRRRARR